MMESREHLFQQEKWVMVEREQKQTDVSPSLSVKAADDKNLFLTPH